MNEALVIRLSDLKLALDKVLAHLSELGYEQVEIPFDSYWHVAMQNATDPENKPTELALGSLEEDWDELERLLAGNRPGPFVTDLRPLAAILNGLSRAVWEFGDPQAEGPRSGKR